MSQLQLKWVEEARLGLERGPSGLQHSLFPNCLRLGFQGGGTWAWIVVGMKFIRSAINVLDRQTENTMMDTLSK